MYRKCISQVIILVVYCYKRSREHICLGTITGRLDDDLG